MSTDNDSVTDLGAALSLLKVERSGTPCTTCPGRSAVQVDMDTTTELPTNDAGPVGFASKHQSEVDPHAASKRTPTTKDAGRLDKNNGNDEKTSWSSIVQGTSVEETPNGCSSGTSGGKKPAEQEDHLEGGKVFCVRSSYGHSPAVVQETTGAAKMRSAGPEGRQEDRDNQGPELVTTSGEAGGEDGAGSPGMIVPGASEGGSQQTEGGEVDGYDPRDQEDLPSGPPPSPASGHSNSQRHFEGFFQIRESKLGGLGAFAARDLKKGETILVEKPLVWTTHFGLMRTFNNLSEAKQTEYLSLHAGEGEPYNLVERIKNLNSFQVPGGIAIFTIASRFNHACQSVRNVQYAFDSQQGVLSLTICQDVVPAGTELLLNYGSSPVELYLTFGFVCECGGCDSLTQEDIKMLYQQEFGDW